MIEISRCCGGIILNKTKLLSIILLFPCRQVLEIFPFQGLSLNRPPTDYSAAIYLCIIYSKVDNVGFFLSKLSGKDKNHVMSGTQQAAGRAVFG